VATTFLWWTALRAVCHRGYALTCLIGLLGLVVLAFAPAALIAVAGALVVPSSVTTPARE
jgi:uncharacterized metal-binding protein